MHDSTNFHSIGAISPLARLAVNHDHANHGEHGDDCAFGDRADRRAGIGFRAAEYRYFCQRGLFGGDCFRADRRAFRSTIRRAAFEPDCDGVDVVGPDDCGGGCARVAVAGDDGDGHWLRFNQSDCGADFEPARAAAQSRFDFFD